MENIQEGESMKKRWKGLILISLTALLFTGCFNITQHISKEGKDLNVFLKFSVSKSIFELSNSMGGKSDENPCEDIFKFNEEQIINTFPKNIEAEYNKVDSELECGYEMYMSVDTKGKEYKKLKKSNAPALFPLVDDGEIYIKFPQSGEEDEGGDQMSAAFMSTALYRLTVNRDVIDEIHEVTFNAGDEFYELSYIELPDIFIIEVPLAYWITSSSDCELIIK